MHLTGPSLNMILGNLVLFLIVICNLQLVTSASGNFYDSNKHIMELDPSNFDRVVHRTNYTTLVEFYAPWCGYCKQLQPIIEAAATKLEGLVQVATVNCDSDKNKSICSQYSIEGFPTLMVFRPPKIDFSKPESKRIKFSHHANELYPGERKLVPIVEFALSRIKNYVKRINSSKKLESILSESSTHSLGLSAILFSQKDKTFNSQKSMALDWLAQVRMFIMPNSKIQPISENSALSQTNPNIFLYLQEKLPKQMENKENSLVLFDTENDIYHEYDEGTFTKKDISKFINSHFHISPLEGPLSNRYRYISAIKNGKTPKRKQKKIKKFHDEL